MMCLKWVNGTGGAHCSEVQQWKAWTKISWGDFFFFFFNSTGSYPLLSLKLQTVRSINAGQLRYRDGGEKSWQRCPGQR